jgi:hypothetical protein
MEKVDVAETNANKSVSQQTYKSSHFSLSILFDGNVLFLDVLFCILGFQIHY